MARTHPSARSHVPTSTSADYLFLLRCDETSAASNLTDELAARTMTRTGSPTVEPSATGDDIDSGARGFDGSSIFAGRAAADGDEAIFQETREGWGVAAWVRIDALPAGEGTVVEYGEWSSPETEATNVQMRLSVINDGTFRISWEEGSGGTNRNNVGDVTIVVGEWNHLGATMRPDPDKLGRAQIDIFFNGVPIARAVDRPWPTGGSGCRWIVGASRALGTAVGTPGSYLDGAIDDLVVTRWAPDVAWFRKQYGRGVQDFEMRGIAGTASQPRAGIFSTCARALVKVPTDEFLTLEKTDLDWVDLTSVNDHDFVQELQWGGSVEDFVATATARLMPRMGCYSMSPFVPDRSGVNDNPCAETTTFGSTPIPLLRAGRRFRIETAVLAAGMRREDAEPHWEVQFDGLIRTVDVRDDAVLVTVMDLGVAMLDVFIEPDENGKDRQYGTAGGIDIEDELQRIIEENAPNRFDIVPTAGGSPDGIDDNGVGSTVIVQLFQNTNSADFNARGRPHPFVAGDPVRIEGTTNYNDDYTVDLADDNALTTVEAKGGLAAEQSGSVLGVQSLSYQEIGTPNLYVETTPGWAVYEWNEVASKGVLQALDDIMGNIGWRVSFKWHEVRQQFRLTLFNPTTSYGSISISDMMSITRLSISVDSLRNVIVGEIALESTTDPTGERAIFAQADIDRTSLRTYGRRMARIRCGTDSLVNTTGEMDELLAIMLEDLRKPVAELDMTSLFNPLVEVQDEVIPFNELGTDMLPQMIGDIHAGACIGFEHTFRSDGSAVTRWRLRNVAEGTSILQSVSRIERHAEIISQRGVNRGRGLSPPTTPAAPTVRNLGNLGGNRVAVVEWPMPVKAFNQAWRLTEVHASTSSSTFTPSSSTLVGVVQGTSCAFVQASASTVYYVRLVSRDTMKNRSAPSAATSFTSAA